MSSRHYSKAISAPWSLESDDEEEEDNNNDYPPPQPQLLFPKIITPRKGGVAAYAGTSGYSDNNKTMTSSSSMGQLLPQVPSSSSKSVAFQQQQQLLLLPSSASPMGRPLSARSLASTSHNSMKDDTHYINEHNHNNHSSNHSFTSVTTTSQRTDHDTLGPIPGRSMPFGPKKKKKRRKIPLMLQKAPGEERLQQEEAIREHKMLIKQYGEKKAQAIEKEKQYNKHTNSIVNKGNDDDDDDGEPKFGVSMDLPQVSSEDFYLGMLGHKDLTCQPDEGNPKFMLYREEFCNCCGVIHPNPKVLDVYGLCPHCFSELRASGSLRLRMKDVKPKQPLEVLFATYGDPEDITTCQVVTEQCMELVAKSHDKDRIAFTVKDCIMDIFEGYDPGPGKNKQLRMRYRVNTVAKGSGVIMSQYGTLVLDFNTKGRIPQPFLLLAQKAKFLRLYEATYGHPKGASQTGRMSYDVLEILQSLVDQNGGSYLCISSMTPLMRLFGDPCPGYTKDLRVKFEIVGRGGQVTYKEIRGHLVKRINIVSAPTISPIIFVISATYGITPTARRDRLEFIAKELKQIQYIEHRKREGLTVTPEELLLCKKKKRLLELRDIFQTIPTKFLDITKKIQQIVDRQKTMLCLKKESFDPNAVFGNPLIGYPKILEIYVDCQGHDSEKITELNEMMDTGYSRNFITMKKARFNIVVEDEEEIVIPTVNANGGGEAEGHGEGQQGGIATSIVVANRGPMGVGTNRVIGTGNVKGKMQESIEFIAEYTCPMIIVTKAMYGELDDLSKLIDVTNDVQGMVKGQTLIIEQDVDLNKVFKIDPSPGRQKQLQIRYITRGFTGNLRVREKDDLFVAGVELGYPPIPPPDDENHEMDH